LRLLPTDPGSIFAAGNNNYKNIVEAAARYDGKLGPVGLFASLGGVVASAKHPANATTIHSLYDVGSLGGNLRLTYENFGFQAALNYAGRSGLAKRLPTDPVYSAKSNEIGGFVGLSYSTGPINIGVNYIAAQGPGSVTALGNERLSEVQLGGHYKIAPGFMLFTGLTFVNAKTDTSFVSGSANGTNNKNTATVFELGSHIIF
jgi:hypothetical protein